MDTVVGGRRPSVADLPRPEYARMVVSEAIRLYPPVHVLGRWAHEPDRFGTHVVPGNSMITFSPYLVHRHPEFWPEPERFDPERFRDPRGGRRHHYAYVPFGAGPRQCVGIHLAMLEAQLLLATFCRQVRLTAAAGHPVEPDPGLSLRPSGSMPMRAVPRV